MVQTDLSFGADGASSPDEADVATKMEGLVVELNHHNHLYHVRDAAEIDDYAYDQLFVALEKYEAEHPQFKRTDSPTN